MTTTDEIVKTARQVFREFNDDADEVFNSDEWAERMVAAIAPLIRADERAKRGTVCPECESTEWTCACGTVLSHHDLIPEEGR